MSVSIGLKKKKDCARMVLDPVAPDPALPAGIFFPVITTTTGFDQEVFLKNLMLFIFKKVRIHLRGI